MKPLQITTLVASGALIPLLGGAIGCWRGTQGVAPENAMWIIYWTAPVVALNVITLVILACLFCRDGLHFNKWIPLFTCSNTVAFLAAFWFLESVSGV